MTTQAGPEGRYPVPSGNAGQAPNNYLVWAVFSFLGCFPLGLIAIINAVKVSNLWALGSYDEARAASENAKKFALFATIAWAVVWGGMFLLFGVLPLLFGATAVLGG
jgi:hypothetical protein